MCAAKIEFKRMFMSNKNEENFEEFEEKNIIVTPTNCKKEGLILGLRVSSEILVISANDGK